MQGTYPLRPKKKWGKKGCISLVIGFLLVGAVIHAVMPERRFARLPDETLNAYAAECQRLLSIVGGEGEMPVEVDVSATRFPDEIMRFGPERIQVRGDYVSIMFRGGRVYGFAVGFHPEQDGEWNLILCNGNRSVTVMTHPQ